MALLHVAYERLLTAIHNEADARARTRSRPALGRLCTRGLCSTPRL